MELQACSGHANWPGLQEPAPAAMAPAPARKRAVSFSAPPEKAGLGAATFVGVAKLIMSGGSGGGVQARLLKREEARRAAQEQRRSERESERREEETAGHFSREFVAKKCGEFTL